jgi:ABC-2 type transport system ATP-binding protein
MIELESVTKSYRKLKAVDNLSVKAEKGEIFGIIGPNGAGKSTTIRMILDIIKPDHGLISLMGEKAPNLDRIGYLPEERGLYKKETVQSMLIYLGRLKGASYSDLNNGLDLWLKRFDLVEWRHKKIESLSKGMSQKVQFISALLHDPDILILDEPFSGLDPLSVEVLKEAIMEEAARGKTVLFSTHVMEQAEKLCHKILLLNKGQTLINGPLAQIKQKVGNRNIQIEFDGDATFIKKLPQVESVTLYPRYLEAVVKEEGQADSLIKEIVPRLSVKRFEVMEPSLHSLFLSLCKPEERQEEAKAHE